MPGIREYVEVTEPGLVVVDSEGNRQTLEADSIVLATGATPNDRLGKSVVGKVGEIYMAGDCAEPGRIVNAIHDGARIGCRI